MILLGAMLTLPGQAQNYRVKAERYERGSYSPQTNPPSVRYTIIDLGHVDPIRVTNSGYVLYHGYYPAGPGRWYQGQSETLTALDTDTVSGTFDINEQGTVVGSIIQHYPGSAPEYGTANFSYDSPNAWYRNASYGVRRAAKWVAGLNTALTLDQPYFPYRIFDYTGGLGYDGLATTGIAWTIDDEGHIYGQAMVDYAEFSPLTEDGLSYLPTRWGAAFSGYDFVEQAKFGNQALVYHSEPLWSQLEGRYTDRYVTEGHPYTIMKVRKGKTIAQGFDYDQFSYFLNGMPIVLFGLPPDFSPMTMNSQGVVLGSIVVDPNSFFSSTRYLIYDPATGVQTDLPMKQSRFAVGGKPVALNNRAIAITNSEGQTTFKTSPQIIGTRGSSAVIWEENPKNGQYFYQYLNLLVPENSGWTLEEAKDINDNGAIICKGTFQPKDADGNPVGEPQTKACLLMPVTE